MDKCCIVFHLLYHHYHFSHILDVLLRVFLYLVQFWEQIRSLKISKLDYARFNLTYPHKIISNSILFLFFTKNRNQKFWLSIQVTSKRTVNDFTYFHSVLVKPRSFRAVPQKKIWLFLCQDRYVMISVAVMVKGMMM